MEKNLQPFHITCVMHNARVSQRMIDWNVKNGTAKFLTIDEEEKLLEIICNHIQENKLRILSLNICADHLHFVLVCDPAEVESIVGKLKSMTAREFNIWRGVTIPNEVTQVPSPTKKGTMGHAPLPGTRNRGITQNSLWAQKFNRVEINSEKQLQDVIDYIINNRIKHKLTPLSEKALSLIKETITDFDKGFE